MKKKVLLFLLLVITAGGAYAAPMRIVSLAPSTTEILYALGLGEQIVGVSQFSDYPAAAREKPSVGTFSDPNVEMILALHPDIIFCTGLEQAPVVEKLKQLKLRVVVSDPSSFRELFRSIEDIGAQTGRSQEAMALNESLKGALEEVAAKAATHPDRKGKRVYIEIWHSPLMTAGKGSFVDEMITAAGGVNIAHDLPRPYADFSAEEVLWRDPQCIIMGYMDKGDITKIVAARLGWDRISAVRTGRVYNDIDSDLLLRPGPRLIEGLKAIYAKLYEE